MSISTKTTIIKISKHLFALNGYEGFSMRTLVKESGVGQSSIYHFFKDKDKILKDIFNITNKELGIARSKIIKTNSAEKMLMDRIIFQFAHIEEVVFILKYYLHFRIKFLKLDSGYYPEKGYLHIEEVLKFGVANNEFNLIPAEIEKEAKAITHTINGFLLEYFPVPPKKDELEEVCGAIHKFLMRGLTNKEAYMN